MSAQEEDCTGLCAESRQQVQVGCAIHAGLTLVDQLLDLEPVTAQRANVLRMKRRVVRWEVADRSQGRASEIRPMRAELVDCVNRSATALRLTEQRLRAAVHVHLELERRVVVAVQKWAEAEGVHDGQSYV